jgi:hypothetical protein
MKKNKNNYWFCQIGPVDKIEIPDGGDFPMRQAVRDTFIKMFRYDAPICSSGWGLSQKEKDIHDSIRILCFLEPDGEKLKKIINILNNEDEKI